MTIGKDTSDKKEKTQQSLQEKPTTDRKHLKEAKPKT
jgi:hypothetical protein